MLGTAATTHTLRCLSRPCDHRQAGREARRKAVREDRLGRTAQGRRCCVEASMAVAIVAGIAVVVADVAAVAAVVVVVVVVCWRCPVCRKESQ